MMKNKQNTMVKEHLTNDNAQLNKGYKNTEIGVIPEEWDCEELSNCLIEKPKYGIGAAAIDFDLNYPTYLRITDIEDDGTLRKDDLKSVNHPETDNYYLKDGEIVFARTGASVGKTYLHKSKNGKLVYAGFLIKISPNNDVLKSEFIKFWTETKTYWNWVKVNSMRSGQPGINGNEYGSLKIPLPPLPEQTAIATVLSDTDNLLQALQKKIAKKQAIKKGAMQVLLKPKEGWVVKTLGEVAEIKMGQSPNSEFYNNLGVGLPLIQGNADIKNRITIIRNYTSQITKKCKVGDIIMSVRAPVGEIAKATFDACIGRGVCAITYSNQYLYHYLIYFESEWSKLSTGSTFESVNSDIIRNLEIPFPKSKQEQTRIAQILSDMDAEIEALEKQLAKYKQVKQGLMQNLLTGKIRLV